MTTFKPLRHTQTVIQKYSYILSKIELFTSIQEFFYGRDLQPVVLQLLQYCNFHHGMVRVVVLQQLENRRLETTVL